MVVPKPLLTEFSIHYRFESCDYLGSIPIKQKKVKTKRVLVVAHLRMRSMSRAEERALMAKYCRSKHMFEKRLSWWR